MQVGQSIQLIPSTDPTQDENLKANGNSGPVAAIVTRVWTNDVVNLIAFPDCGSPVNIGSVLPVPTVPDGQRYYRTIE